MKSGKTSLYLSDRLANLLDAHGPAGNEGERNLGEKLGYIVAGWDRILRDEMGRWKSRISREEWEILQSATVAHAFHMSVGGPAELDIASVALCVQDSIPEEMGATAEQLDTLYGKLHQASVAAQYAIVWMLLRERNRTA